MPAKRSRVPLLGVGRFRGSSTSGRASASVERVVRPADERSVMASTYCSMGICTHDGRRLENVLAVLTDQLLKEEVIERGGEEGKPDVFRRAGRGGRRLGNRS